MEQLLTGKNLYYSLLKILLGYQRLYFCYGTKVLPCLGRFKKTQHTRNSRQNLKCLHFLLSVDV